MFNRLYYCLPVGFVFLLAAAGCAPPQPREIALYISRSGNDSWSGELPIPNSRATDGPFATLERAREAVRSLKETGLFPEGGVTIYVREGAYPRTATFTLTGQDAGTETFPVVWRSYPGETVQLVGAREVTGFEPVREPSARERIDDEYHDNILQADLAAQGITRFGEVTELKENAAPGMELFFRDERMTLARWPNEGWVEIADVPQTGTPVYEGTKPHKRFGIYVGRHYGRFTYEGDRPKRWSRVEEIVLHGYFAWDWQDTFIRVSSIDTSRREIYPREPHTRFGYHRGQRYYALNILEELDSPGEWYLDRTSGIMYFWPPAPIETGRVFVSMLEDPLVMLRDTEYVTLRGLNFECSRGHGVVLTGGTHNLIAGCTFRNLGHDAARIESGTNNGITGCDIYEVAMGGIVLKGGDRATLTPAGNFAVNNHIHHYSRWTQTYQAAIRMEGVGNRLAHNHIHDAPHTGIVPFGNDQIIEYNELHHLALQTGDVGAIRFDGIVTERGNVVRYNYFHHILGPGKAGAIGVYLDDFTCGVTVYGNIFYRVGRATFIGGGRDNIIENNIMIEGDPAVHIDARGLSWARKNITYRFPEMYEKRYNEPPYSERYPELLGYFNDNPAIPIDNRVLRNISYGGWWLEVDDTLDPSILEMKDNLIADPVLVKMRLDLQVNPSDSCRFRDDVLVYPSGDRKIREKLAGNLIIDSDPGFVDAANEDFRLREDSPAWKLGFKRIPIEEIGLMKDEYRKALSE